MKKYIGTFFTGLFIMSKIGSNDLSILRIQRIKNYYTAILLCIFLNLMSGSVHPAHAMEPDFPYQPLSSVLLALQNFLIILLPLRLSPRKVSGKNLLFLLLMQYIQLRKHCFVDDPAMSVRHCRLPFCPVPHPRTRLITNKRNIF